MTRSKEGGRAAVCALVTGFWLAACGGGDHAGSPGGDDDDLPDGGSLGTDAVPPDAPIDAEGPVVEILAPTAPAAGDYSSDAILTGDRVQVICLVERNEDTGDPIDSASVQIGAVSGERSVEAAGIAGPSNQYTATLDVGDFPNGSIAIRCSASDLATEPRTNSAEVGTFLDLGPTIEVFGPGPGQPFGSQVDVSFRVSEAPVAGDDSGAAVADVALVAGQVPIELTSNGGGNYSATIVFDAPEFDPPLDGPVALTIQASNARAPAPVVRTVVTPFVADSDGPVILIAEPAAGRLVAGFMGISVDVADTAGIETVTATIAHQYEIELPPVGGQTYAASFDTRLLDESWVFPLLEVRTRDLVGNESSVGRVVALDNRAPLVSMDSPSMREAQCPAGNFCSLADGPICSVLFDPLGLDAADDGEVVAGLMELRVRAEDLGNGALAPSGVVIPLAGIDESSVEFFVLDDDGGELLVDTDQDGVCDAINPALVPATVPDTANEAAVVTLVAVPPTGAPFYAETTGPFSSAEAGCTNPGVEADDEPPSPLCISSPTTRVPATDFGAAVLFSIPPTDDPWCVGNAFDAPATNIADGWACVAAVAPDALGNVGVSPPLRICIDHDGDRLDGGGASLEALGCGVGGNGQVDFGDIAAEGDRPACTDGCTPPLSFADFPSMQIRITGGQ